MNLNKDLENIEKYCHTLNIKYYNSLSEETKNILVHVCLELLKKYPDKIPITKILKKYDISFFEIEKIIKIPISSFDTNSFELNGVITLPIIGFDELKNIQREFLDTLKHFPEYKSKKGISAYVLGGFAALGNPSSFHNELVRKLRVIAFNKVKKRFKQYCDGKVGVSSGNWYIQCLVDRMMYRLKGQKPVAESWHRDVIPSKYVCLEDEIFGGWINLDDQDQFFSCIPGSHLGYSQNTLKNEGFVTLEKIVYEKLKIIYKKEIEKLRGDKKHISNFLKIKYKPILDEIVGYGRKIRIPPGHIIIFPQYILHEVVATKATHNMMRLFTGWRITKNKPESPLFPLSLFEDQAVIPLPGGAIPPMYSPNHTSYFMNKSFEISPGIKSNLEQWSNATFKEELLVTKMKNDGEKYRVIPRHLESLKKYKLPLYPEYTEEEISMYIGRIL